MSVNNERGSYFGSTHTHTHHVKTYKYLHVNDLKLKYYSSAHDTKTTRQRKDMQRELIFMKPVPKDGIRVYFSVIEIAFVLCQTLIFSFSFFSTTGTLFDL